MCLTQPMPELPWKTVCTTSSVLESTISTELLEDSPELHAMQTWRGKEGSAAKWDGLPAHGGSFRRRRQRKLPGLQAQSRPSAQALSSAEGLRVEDEEFDETGSTASGNKEARPAISAA